MYTIAVALRWDFQVKGGASWHAAFAFTDAAHAALSIAADDIHFTVRERVGGRQLLHKVSPAGGHLNGRDGLCTFSLTAAELTPGVVGVAPVANWVYDVSRVVGGGTGTRHVWFAGPFTVHLNVPRAVPAKPAATGVRPDGRNSVPTEVLAAPQRPVESSLL